MNIHYIENVYNFIHPYIHWCIDWWYILDSEPFSFVICERWTLPFESSSKKRGGFMICAFACWLYLIKKCLVVGSPFYNAMFRTGHSGLWHPFNWLQLPGRSSNLISFGCFCCQIYVQLSTYLLLLISFTIDILFKDALCLSEEIWRLNHNLLYCKYQIAAKFLSFFFFNF